MKNNTTDKEKKFITDNDVINNISDDMIYIRELVAREKNLGVNLLKASHLGRLVTVFIYNSLEAHRDFLARSIGATDKCLDWNSFLDHSVLTPIFKKMIEEKFVGFDSLQDVKTIVLGLQALRNFISHGLVDESAKDFKKKIAALESADLKISPTKFTVSDIDKLLALDCELTNLFGMARAVYSFKASR